MRMTIKHLLPSAAGLCSVLLFLAGCEAYDYPEGSQDFRNANNNYADPADPAEGAPAVGDGASYSSFRWDYGGFNGSGASQSGVQISGMSVSSGNMSFRYDTDMSAWGMAHTDANALACWFVQDNDGRWVGGKFDWISSSRTSRSLSHVTSGYNGWTLDNVPNPCQVAFVIVHADGKRRSNVLTGTWKR